MFGEVRKTPAGVDDVAVVAQVILAGLRTSLVRNGSRRAVFAACQARITELRNTGVDWMIDCHIQRECHTTHAEKRPKLWMNNRAVTAQFAKPCLETNRNMEQVAI